MPRPFPRRTYHRAAALRATLDPIIAELDAIPLTHRRSPMRPSLHGRGWRVVDSGRSLLGLPPLLDSTDRKMPGALVVEIVSILDRLTTLKPLHRLASPGVHQKSYPRARRRE